MDTMTKTPNAIDAVTEPLDGRWPYRFTVRGREYVIGSGCWSFGDDAKGAYVIIPACPIGKPQRKLTLHAGDKVQVLSYMGHWDYQEVPV